MQANMMSWKQTWTGRSFDLLLPSAETVSLEDISQSLGKLNRFTGHTKWPYSVAQHCLFCADLATPQAAVHALLHDAEEAYTGDVSAPMKMALHAHGAGEALRDIADSVRAAIYTHFGLLAPGEEMRRHIKDLDMVALATEKRDMLRVDVKWGVDLPMPHPEPLRPLAWWDAAELYYKRARSLGLGR
jgi:hypothetical protein